MQNSLKRTIILVVFLIYCTSIFGQLTINISSTPDNTSPDDSLYFASNLNNWNPNDTNYILTNKNHGIYQIIFTPPIGMIEYKFTQGDWSSVESDAKGLDIPNRTLAYTGSPQTINVTIASWKEANPVVCTAAKNVNILKENFYIPQLNRSRKIWVYLPSNYDTSDKSYSVLYMHDGQNLFDDSTSFSEEWKVDESLNHLFEKKDEGVIVIGIENGAASRIDEYTPWPNVKYGGGEGEKYIDFIVETLKPYVDANYRTKPDRLHTAIMGSSLGGLISFYAAIRHQDVFSKAGIFSPSFWFSEEIYKYVETIGKQHDVNFYLLGGELESDNLILSMNEMVTMLYKIGFKESQIKMITKVDGKHNEAFWAREFSDCYLWLFR